MTTTPVEHDKPWFEAALKQLDMTKTELAEVIGIGRNRIYKWKEPPKYVVAYLLAALSNRELTEKLVTKIMQGN